MPTAFRLILQDGLESKNSKTRVVCLEEIAAMVERHGPVIYGPASAASAAAAGGARGAASGGSGNEPVMVAVAKLVTERDPAVRAGCLAVVEALFNLEGAGGCPPPCPSACCRFCCSCRRVHVVCMAWHLCVQSH
jgi:hypothetical protein